MFSVFFFAFFFFWGGWGGGGVRRGFELESFLLGYGLLSLHMGVPMVHSKVKSFHLIINTHTHTPCR